MRVPEKKIAIVAAGRGIAEFEDGQCPKEMLLRVVLCAMAVDCRECLRFYGEELCVPRK